MTHDGHWEPIMKETMSVSLVRALIARDTNPAAPVVEYAKDATSGRLLVHEGV